MVWRRQDSPASLNLRATTSPGETYHTSDRARSRPLRSRSSADLTRTPSIRWHVQSSYHTQMTPARHVGESRAIQIPPSKYDLNRAHRVNQGSICPEIPIVDHERGTRCSMAEACCSLLSSIAIFSFDANHVMQVRTEVDETSCFGSGPTHTSSSSGLHVHLYGPLTWLRVASPILPPSHRIPGILRRPRG